jgi:hypothetical protein
MKKKKIGIEELVLSPRTYRGLIDAHLHFLDDVIQCSRADLLKLHSFGKVSLIELQSELFAVGLSLSGKSKGGVEKKTQEDCAYCLERKRRDSTYEAYFHCVQSILPLFEIKNKIDDLYELRLPFLVEQIESYEKQIFDSQARLKELKELVLGMISKRVNL